MSTPAVTFEVHLAGAVAEAVGVDSPVEADRIDSNESGIWVDGPGDRSFYPWTQVLAIRERSSTTGDPAGGGEESAAEPEPAPPTEPPSGA